eukprot:757741-Hanusia_phi.AAC.1
MRSIFVRTCFSPSLPLLSLLPLPSPYLVSPPCSILATPPPYPLWPRLSSSSLLLISPPPSSSAPCLLPSSLLLSPLSSLPPIAQLVWQDFGLSGNFTQLDEVVRAGIDFHSVLETLNKKNAVKSDKRK